ncbi:hypothetical protein [Streptomyces sp. AC558_RSS880]|nr:hypothetical protein [Streptomyces sp. AC558_RSS880]
MAVLYSGGNPPPVDAADVPRWKWGAGPALAAGRLTRPSGFSPA